MQPAVYLDRDGVLNIPKIEGFKPYAPRHFNSFRLYDDVIYALNNLSDAGFALVVVTNQPDVGNGLVDIDEIHKMHRYLMDSTPITAIKMCTHKQDDLCLCRKPQPKMISDAAIEMNLDLSSSWIIGDRITDMKAGASVGLAGIYIDRGYQEVIEEGLIFSIFSSLKEASNFILLNHLSRKNKK
jgi:D-glycero-D-manno-heptose 1,7-bisphosphate phosphatase